MVEFEEVGSGAAEEADGCFDFGGGGEVVVGVGWVRVVVFINRIESEVRVRV